MKIKSRVRLSGDDLKSMTCLAMQCVKAKPESEGMTAYEFFKEVEPEMIKHLNQLAQEAFELGYEHGKKEANYGNE